MNTNPERRLYYESGLLRRETRILPARIELREADDGTVGLLGWASVFDQEYEVYDMFGPYMESVAQGAFTKTLREKADVRLLVNHEGIPLARTKSGTLFLEEDDVGLRSDAPSLDLPQNPTVQELVSGMRRGDIDEMSFSFRTIRQEWDEDYMHRKLLEVKLFDVSVVTFPANPYTSVGLRTAELVTALASADPDLVLAEVRAAGMSFSPEVVAAAQERLARLAGDSSGISPEGDNDSTIPIDIVQRELVELKQAALRS